MCVCILVFLSLLKCIFYVISECVCVILQAQTKSIAMLPTFGRPKEETRNPT